ncbi:undecaprenyldiphospho-muramoylpentapeptide beta-N-acetylglucosaminyltransferase [Iodidimonas gelatinilytica]|nr:undecaprenyldiphospho-muramoylpentapeptide beta-N-acetylglucosaminyltransferase [Iodidimonas gelatinilytica]
MMVIAKQPIKVMIAAGGTGGHMMPAYALSLELQDRGHITHLVTDKRGAAVPGPLADQPVHILDSGRMTGGLWVRARALARIVRNIRVARRLLREERPNAVIGFGGYPALPTLLAARSLKIPICLHEQNAVLGRVNRLMAPMAEAIGLSYPDTEKLSRGMRARTVLTGNPVRNEVAALAAKPYPALDEDHMLRLLVVGGSLGARVLSDVVPDALALLPPHLKNRLQVTQQCREEDLEKVRARYKDAGIAAELASFIADMPERLMWTHLAIARAGATTLAELMCGGRPSILVPLPIATDDHQTKNARHLADQGGGWLIPETDFTPQTLAKRLQRLALEPERLRVAARRAHQLGRPQAAETLADLVEEIASMRGVRPDQSASGKSASPFEVSDQDEAMS